MSSPVYKHLSQTFFFRKKKYNISIELIFSCFSVHCRGLHILIMTFFFRKKKHNIFIELILSCFSVHRMSLRLVNNIVRDYNILYIYIYI